MMYIFNLTDRKPLLEALTDITHEKPRYMKVPTCAFRFAHFDVDRAGNIITAEDADPDEMARLMQDLFERGFTFTEIEDEAPAATAEDDEPAAPVRKRRGRKPKAQAPEPEIEPITDLTVGVTAEGFDEAALGRLRSLIDSKRALLKKALGVDDLPIEVADGEIKFPWFRGPMAPEDAQAYIALIAKLCEMARTQKRITAKEKPAENEKYAFRCFLLRLGFIGDEFKAYRKVLMKNLTGSAAFRVAPTGEDPADE